MSSNTEMLAGPPTPDTNVCRVPGYSRLVTLTITTPADQLPAPPETEALPTSRRSPPTAARPVVPTLRSASTDPLDPLTEQQGVAARVLQVLACLTVGTASVEGYLQGVGALGTVLSKVPAALLVLAWVAVRVYRGQPLRRHSAHAWLAGLGVVVLASAAVHASKPSPSSTSRVGRRSWSSPRS